MTKPPLYPTDEERAVDRELIRKSRESIAMADEQLNDSIDRINESKDVLARASSRDAWPARFVV